MAIDVGHLEIGAEVTELSIMRRDTAAASLTPAGIVPREHSTRDRIRGRILGHLLASSRTAPPTRVHHSGGSPRVLPVHMAEVRDPIPHHIQNVGEGGSFEHAR